MLNDQKIKSKYKKYLLLAVMLFAFVSLWRNLIKIQKAKETIENKGAKVESLAAQQESLKKQLTEVESEAFLEKQLRDKLGYAKEGEIVVVLPDEQTLREIGKVDKGADDVLPDPNWVLWKKLFGF